MSCPDSSLCVHPWRHHQGYCYLTGKVPKSFLEANDDCIRQRANLAQITSDEVNTFVANLNGAQRVEQWIGYTDFHKPGEWIWTGDYSGASYSKWRHGYPKTEGEDCALILPDGTWVNRHCRTEQQYVCKRGKVIAAFGPFVRCGHCPPDPNPRVLTTSLILEWSGRVFWHASLCHCAIGLSVFDNWNQNDFPALLIFFLIEHDGMSTNS